MFESLLAGSERKVNSWRTNSPAFDFDDRNRRPISIDFPISSRNHDIRTIKRVQKGVLKLRQEISHTSGAVM